MSGHDGRSGLDRDGQADAGTNLVVDDLADTLATPFESGPDRADT